MPKAFFTFQKDMERFMSLWFVLCYVGMLGLSVVNIIHAVQMLTHRHDSGVHHALYLFAVSALDLVMKLGSLPFFGKSTLFSFTITVEDFRVDTGP